MILVSVTLGATPPATAGWLPGPTAPAQPFIVNGTETTEHLNVAALVRGGGPGLTAFCTATLVHERFVLTAAHCVEAWQDPTWVVFGSDLDAGVIEAQVRALAAVPHPAYDPTRYLDDIAVVELEAPVTGVLPAALDTTRPGVDRLGEPLRFVGFGKPDDTSSSTGTKRQTDIPLVGWDLQTLFASAPDTNVCQGDSGGPVFRATEGGWTLTGVITFTLDGCVGGDSGATRVDVQLDWLSTVLPALVLEPLAVEDTDVDTDVAIDLPRDTGWGEPTLPTRGTYPLGLRCEQASGNAIGAGWFAGLAALARRRR